MVYLGINVISLANPVTQNLDETSPCLIVWHKDGSKVVFYLSETPKISYVEEKVHITTSSTIEYDFQSIKKMTYGMDDVDEIKNLIINKENPFIRNGETITIIPADKDMQIKVVALNGSVIKEWFVKRGEYSSFSMNSVPMNIYLIVVNGVTYKIKK